MEKKEEQASYFMGLAAGKQMRAQFPELAAEHALRGYKHGVEGEGQEVTDEKLAEVMGKINESFQKQQQEALEKLAEHNKELSEKFLEENKTKEGIKLISNGLQYRVLESSSKEDAASPKLIDGVEMHYTLKTPDGQVIDSSRKSGSKEPAKFMVNQVIPGWTEILPMMKEGDKWEVFIPPYLGYGAQGYQGVIAPNQLLIFEMELVKVHQPASSLR